MRDHSLDAATIALYERVRRTPQNQALIAAVEAPATEFAAPPAEICSRTCLVLVPGIFYRDYPHTGADGAALKEIAASLGIPVVTVPLDGTEGRDVAAATIRTWLQSKVTPSRTIVLVSLSKGSTEVMRALDTAAGDLSAFDRVAAWISVSGLPLGTPSLELVLRNPLRRFFLRALCFFKGWKLEILRDLLRYRPSPAAQLPAHLAFIQVAAFPLHRHLNDGRSRRFHLQLAGLGPNDGFAPLETLAGLPGMIYPMWGADHYLQGTPDLSVRIRNLLAFVLRDNPGAAGPSG